jgi:hypothetical protein
METGMRACFSSASLKQSSFCKKRGSSPMTRIAAGFIGGLIGIVLIILVRLSSLPVPGLSFIAPLAGGIVVGILVARNEKFGGKTAGAGALAGLIAGALMFIASIVDGVLYVNSPVGQSIVSDVAATVTASPNGGGGVNGTTLASVTLVTGFCIAGLLYFGITTGIGAIAGAIAGRGTVAPQVNPYGQFGTAPPYGAPPQGYPPPPPNYPQSPYGTQEQPPKEG